MLLFVLRCSFWMAVVAMALPWFTADNAQNAPDAVAARPSAPKAQIARAVPARYFDDTTGSLSPVSGCADRATDCGESAPKVDLIALQLESRVATPKAAPSRTNGAPVSGRISGPRHVVAKRAASISDLLAR